MGFFSSKSKQVIVPIGKLFDTGVFSDAPENKETKRVAEGFESSLQQTSPFLNSDLFTKNINDLASRSAGELSPQFVDEVLNQLAGGFNARGLGEINKIAAANALAPHAINARNSDIAASTLFGNLRQSDLALLMELLKESRPDFAVGQSIASKSTPSVLQAIDQLGFVMSGGSGLNNASQIFGNVAGGAAALGGLSDRRFKKEIKAIGVHPNGLNVYSFKYIWGGPTIVGFMSDEVRALYSSAVNEVDGIDFVDYAQLI